MGKTTHYLPKALVNCFLSITSRNRFFCCTVVGLFSPEPATPMESLDPGIRGVLSPSRDHEAGRISSMALFSTPNFSSASCTEVLFNKYRSTSPSMQPSDAVPYLITFNPKVIRVSSKIATSNPALTQIPSRLSTAVLMNRTIVDMGLEDELEAFGRPRTADTSKAFESKEKQCEELRATVENSARSIEALEKDLRKAEAQLDQALLRENERYQECVRMDARLQTIDTLQSKIQSAYCEIKKLRKSLAQAESQAEFREDAFETEKLAWVEERGRLQTRIASLVESLQQARTKSLLHRPRSSAATQPEQSPSKSALIPSEVQSELTELRQLVPAYVETLDMMDVTIENLNGELQDLHDAYNEVMEQNLGQQELIDALNAQILEAGPAPANTTLKNELCSVLSQPSTFSCESQDKVLGPQREPQNQQRKSYPDEFKELKETNQKLREYLERLLNRIIGLEAFEHVLNLDFEAIRNTSHRMQQPFAIQCPDLRARRKISSNLAIRTIRQLKVTKLNFINKLKNSQTRGIRTMAKSLAKLQMHDTYARRPDLGSSQFELIHGETAPENNTVV